MTEENKKFDFEKVVKMVLIVLTLLSIIYNMFYLAYGLYRDTYTNIMPINDFLLKLHPFIFIDNFAIYIFAIIYIVHGIKSKKEVLLKVSFSIFSILSTIIVTTLIINEIAEAFGVFK